MIAIVTATGARTFFGKTAALVASAEAPSHFQKAVITIGDYLIFLSIALAAALVLVQLHRGAPTLELLQFALILTVAAIPVAMPAVLSMTMAVGAMVLAREKAIVSRLQSIDGNGRHRHSLLRQDRHADPEQADAGRALALCRERRAGTDPRRRAGLESRGPRRHRSGGDRGSRRSRRHGVLQADRLCALRPGRQAHRGDGARAGWRKLALHQGSAAGHPRPRRRGRRGADARASGRRWFRRQWLPHARRRPVVR